MDGQPMNHISLKLITGLKYVTQIVLVNTMQASSISSAVVTER